MHSSLSIEIAFDIPRCCRACLTLATPESQNDFVELLRLLDETIKDSSAKTQTLLDCYNECARLDVTEDQLQSKQLTAGEYADCRYLCQLCHEELRRAHDFISRVRLSELVLSEHILEFKTETVEVAEEDAAALKEDELTQEEDTPEQYKPKDYVSLAEEGTASECEFNALEQELADMFAMDREENLSHEIEAELVAAGVSEIEHKEQNTHISVERVEAEEQNREKTEIGDILVKYLHSDEEENIEMLEQEEEQEDEEEERRHYFEFKCEFCTAKFDYQRDLLQHYEKDHDDKNLHFPCELCAGRFVTKTALCRHKRQIHQKCVYIDCAQCGRTVLKSFYGIHLKRHAKQLKLLCSKCPNTFTSKYTLKKHMELHSETRDRNAECLDCGRKFFTLDNLQLHQATHQHRYERVTYECTICNKSFVRKSNLKLHMQLHRGETIDCPHCGKKFVRRKDLEIHVRFHTGDFPYDCKVCGKKFAIKGHLNYHEKRHSGVRYKCNECEKTFINLAGLKQHSFEHTGMPLECRLCMRGFPTKFKMRRHIRNVHHTYFEQQGYTDELAEQYIKQHAGPKTDLALELVKDEDFDGMGEIEMLLEHEEDITENMLLT